MKSIARLQRLRCFGSGSRGVARLQQRPTHVHSTGRAGQEKRAQCCTASFEETKTPHLTCSPEALRVRACSLGNHARLRPVMKSVFSQPAERLMEKRSQFKCHQDVSPLSHTIRSFPTISDVFLHQTRQTLGNSFRFTELQPGSLIC